MIHFVPIFWCIEALISVRHILWSDSRPYRHSVWKCFKITEKALLCFPPTPSPDIGTLGLQVWGSEKQKGERGHPTTAIPLRRFDKMLVTCQQHFPFQNLIWSFLAMCMRDSLNLGRKYPPSPPDGACWSVDCPVVFRDDQIPPSYFTGRETDAQGSDENLTTGKLKGPEHDFWPLGASSINWEEGIIFRTARRSNQSILKEINREYSLERLMLKLQYFGHQMQRADSLEKTLMLGKI